MVPTTLRRGSRFASELTVIVIGQVAVAVAGLAGVRLFTSHMSAEAYGDLSLGLTIAALLIAVLMGPLVQTSLRLFTPYSERKELSLLIGGLKPIVVIVT